MHSWRILPYLVEFRESGGSTLFECTPAYLGRDPVLLKRLSDSTHINIITNTGYYGAAGEKFFPDHVFTETAEQLAARWISEWKDGIDGSGIRPGFMKLSADKAPLTEAQAKTIHAAAIAHLQTGLPIGVHNGDGRAAQEELSILESHGVRSNAFIWIHAQNERDSSVHKLMADRGAWIEFDGLNENNVLAYVGYLKFAKSNGFLEQVLVSHDAGWYHVGEPGGGTYRGYLVLKQQLIPMLTGAGFTPKEIGLITIDNPAKAFAITVRKR